LPAALSVVLIEPADENHHFATVWKCFTERLAAQQARVEVVHSDVDLPVCIRRIGIVRDQN
jgi:hypothetical protein